MTIENYYLGEDGLQFHKWIYMTVVTFMTVGFGDITP
jgi:hypothetical protein